MDDATISAVEIARLAGVGRAAVSNWRRRYADFPAPTGGTASSPLFSLAAVQSWMAARGKHFELTTGERAWRRLRALGDDLDLGARLSRAGEYLVHRHEDVDPELASLLDDLTAEIGAAAAFELLFGRYVEAHSRQLSNTPEPIACLMARLVGRGAETVLDPACGFGTLLLSSVAPKVLGRDADPIAASIAALRLALHDYDGEVRVANSLREDGFSGAIADAVLCDPPFNERVWGHDELIGDTRWEYGLPPRGESELAWVQHCLARVKPGGLVAILMPGAPAARRSGKRIRGNLLRAGALRAIFTLAPAGPDLWLLRRPEPGGQPPSTVLLAGPVDEPSTVERLWREYERDPGESGTRIIDVLDDDIDLTPARRQGGAEDSGRAFAEAYERFSALPLAVPSFEPGDAEPAFTTIGELLKAGVIELRHAPARTVEGEHPQLTLDDLAAGRAPTGRAEAAAGEVLAAAGDVVASVTGLARVHSGPTVRVGPALSVYRVDPERLDAWFLVGCLRAAELPANSGSTRIDVRRTRIPRHPVETQRVHGRAFARLTAFDDAVREAAEIGRTLVRLGFAGLTEGRLEPGSAQG
ncbi:class I SAM-dependent DNA methyltransferase [Amycolatopsis sp. NPDC059027]|uniref:HsdM family class I SAM-dependent methyltransferase n=1 Tax=unclassified Amycolatopsis TaxID=2618356 RepID=UPI00366CDB07